MNGINETITHINDMYLAFNKALKAELPESVVFSLIPNRSSKGRYLGWFAQNRWSKGADRLHEINIAADHLDRDVDGIAETILHEMVHLKNNINGVSDCTPTQYHKKAFKTVAESFGLKVERMKNKGYALTSLGDDARKLVTTYKADILKGENPFTIHRVPEVKLSKPNPKKSVQVDKDLAEEVLTLTGEKLGAVVERLLREYVVGLEM